MWKMNTDDGDSVTDSRVMAPFNLLGRQWDWAPKTSSLGNRELTVLFLHPLQLIGSKSLAGKPRVVQCRLYPVQMPASPPRPTFRASQHNRSSKAVSYTWQNRLHQHYRGLLNPKPTQILISTSCFIKLIISNLWEQSQRVPAFPLTEPSANPSLFPLGCI